MFLNSTSLRITWEPPLLQDQNGVIRGYNISYNVSNSEEETDFFVSSTTIDLTGLQKFTFYDVSVQAFTVGSGPTVSTVVRTDSDGKLCKLTFLTEQLLVYFAHTNLVNSIIILHIITYSILCIY